MAAELTYDAVYEIVRGTGYVARGKALALQVLDTFAARIADEQVFYRSNGTSQLEPKGREFDEHVARAVD